MIIRLRESAISKKQSLIYPEKENNLNFEAEMNKFGQEEKDLESVINRLSKAENLGTDHIAEAINTYVEVKSQMGK